MRRYGGTLLLTLALVAVTVPGPSAAANGAPRATAFTKAWFRPDARRRVASLGPKVETRRSLSGTCVGQAHTDTADANQFDASSYGLFFDCGDPGWTFSVTTRDSWSDGKLYYVALLADVDGNRLNGCDGFDRDIEGSWSTTTGHFTGVVATVPSCDPSSLTVLGKATVTRSSVDQVSLHFANDLFGSPQDVEWYAAISGQPGDPNRDIDFMPNDNGTWLSSNLPCPTAAAADGSARYVLTGAPAPPAVSALRTAGLRDVRSLAGGVVTFSGDVAHAGAALQRAGVGGRLSVDRLRPLSDVPDDTGYPSQWNLHGPNSVNAEAAWTATHGSPSVKVAVIDTGADVDHAELAGKLVQPYNASTGTTNVADDVGHGTAVSGVIAAATDNSSGLAGLGWDTTVMPIKANVGSFIADSAAVAGLHYAADNGAQVVNMSFGGDCNDTALADGVAYAQTKGLLLVAAAGNEAQAGNPVEYPAASPGVLGVGGTSTDGTHASFANTGAYVDLAAPAVDVPVLHATGTDFPNPASGTSFSSPMVAATAALLLAKNPFLSPTSAGELLLRTAQDKGAAGYDQTFGEGLLDAGAAAGAALTTPPRGGTYVPLQPARILDTRDASSGDYRTPVPADTHISVQVAGRGGVPSRGAVGVVMNVTVDRPTTSGYLTVSPTGLTRPVASNLNFVAKRAVPNLVVAKLGVDGRVDLYNYAGWTDAIVDVVGWFSDGTTTGSGSRYTAVDPSRVLDTRNGTGGFSTPVGAGQSIAVDVTGVGGVPDSGATAVVLNVTATAATASSYLTVYPDETARPLASNLNFGANQSVPNLVVVKVGANGKVRVYNNAGSAHVIFDVVGWYGDPFGERFVPLPPARILDTRNGTGGYTAPVGPGQSIVVPVHGNGGVPVTDARAVVVNVTVTGPTATSYLTLYPDQTTRPLASNLNFVAGQTVPNLVAVRMANNGNVVVYNNAGIVHVIFDVVGYYKAAA